MRKPKYNAIPKPGQIGDFWLSKNPDRAGPNDAWCRTWYDKSSRQTRRASLGTKDLREASLRLSEWVAKHGKLHADIAQDKVLIEAVLLSYWYQHASKLPSANTALNGIRYWAEYWTKKTVADITPHTQVPFRKWLKGKGLDDGGIDRVLADGKAALKRAVKWQELESAPHIFFMQKAEDRRSRDPLGRPIVPK